MAEYKSPVVIAAEAMRDFSTVAERASQTGRVVILQDDSPKWLVIDLDVEPQIEMTEDEKLRFVAERILREHKAAFEELAKR